MTVKRNVIANFAGSAWSALMGLAFIPLYIKMMGAESYGIVGVFASLIGMLAVLDMGLSQAMNREMARLSVDPNSGQRMADTARTLECIYWAIALGAVVVLVAFSDFIAFHWLNPESLSREAIRQALWIMALVIGLRWPVAIYTGGLNGLQRQVLVNILQTFTVTLQAVGAIAVLWLIEPTIQAFFFWQALVALVQVAIFHFALWRCLPNASRARFSREVLADVWRFAAGMTGVSLVSVILTQVDKVLLSKLLSLTDFGYYTFAATIAAVIYKIVIPVFTSYYPRLTELVSSDDRKNLILTFHQGCQLMAVIVLPATLVLAFFSKDILYVWTNNLDVVEHTYLLVSLLVVGNALSGLIHIPYALQLAYGWTRLAFYQNVIAIIIIIPSIYYFTDKYGSMGAASVWLILNIFYLLISMQVMFKYLLVDEKNNWYFEDILKIFIPVFIVISITKYFYIQNLNKYEIAIYLLIVIFISTITAVISSSKFRHIIRDSYFKTRLS